MLNTLLFIVIAILCHSIAAGATLAEFARTHTITVRTVVDRDSTVLDHGDQTNNLKPGEKIVSLSSKGLTSIDGIAKLKVRDGDRDVELSSIPKLHLYLNDNAIGRLPAEFFGMHNVIFLYMNIDRLNAIPREIAGMHNLQGMYFTANNLHEIAPEVFTMTWLKKLQVSKNHLTELPAAIGNLTELMHFNISQNQIAVLPDSIERLTKLRVCDFSDNRITRLPEGFGKVRIMHQLRVRNNPMTMLPEGFAGMQGSIDITGTKIRMESLSPGLRAQIGTEKR